MGLLSTDQPCGGGSGTLRVAQPYSRGQSISSLLSSHAVQPSHCQNMGMHCIFPLRQANCPGLQRCSGTQQKSHCEVKPTPGKGKSAKVSTKSHDTQVSDAEGMKADADENNCCDYESRTDDPPISAITLVCQKHKLTNI